MIQPTIGRQVWFWRDTPQKDQQPEAATVVYVHGDSLVNLQVLDLKARSRAELKVSLRQPEDPPVTGKHAQWMPFQIGQARKEQLASGGKP